MPVETLMKNTRYDLFRLPADYEGPLVAGGPDGNNFDPPESLCVKCLRCHECGADVEALMPIPWRRFQR